jgi:hypothetical protein
MDWTLTQEEAYRLCRVIVCDQETSRNEPARGSSAWENNNNNNNNNNIGLVVVEISNTMH